MPLDLESSAGAVLLVAIIVIAIIVAYFIPFRLWLSARASGVPISLYALFGMRMRRIPPADIVNPLINAVRAGVNVSREQLESLRLSNGNVALVVNALIAASSARIHLDFDQAKAIDLAGRNVFEAVRTSVEPRVIDCPNPAKGRETIDGVAKDGIQLKVKARVTVRTNIEQLIGGATEETIIARVGEGIVTTIGSAATHKDVLENPNMISERVKARGLDAGTAFSILSIDIADIDVGQNIGARLQIDQAEADKQIAQARAEERRALAVAREQEMRALEQEMRAKVVESEADVPRALAEAFRKGNLGIMDYYRMQNIKADTSMRERISGVDEGQK